MEKRGWAPRPFFPKDTVVTIVESVSWLTALIPHRLPGISPVALGKGLDRLQWRVRAGFTPASHYSTELPMPTLYCPMLSTRSLGPGRPNDAALWSDSIELASKL